jgi:hypothetical protein
MLAVALARAAVEAGLPGPLHHRVDLAARATGRHRGPLTATMRFYAGPRLLVVDEVGYLPWPRAAAAPRSSPSATCGIGIPTTNPGIVRGRFDYPTVAAAMLDRLLHAGPCSTSTATATARAHRARAESLQGRGGLMTIMGRRVSKSRWSVRSAGTLSSMRRADASASTRRAAAYAGVMPGGPLWTCLPDAGDDRLRVRRLWCPRHRRAALR